MIYLTTSRHTSNNKLWLVRFANGQDITVSARTRKQAIIAAMRLMRMGRGTVQSVKPIEE